MNLADNALIRRGLYGQLRMPAGAIGIVIAGAVSLGLLGIFMNAGRSQYNDNSQGMTACFFILFGLQSLFLVLGGTQHVATQVAADREIGILDFHRISSQEPWQIAMGYLGGMPIREWAWLAATLPASVMSAFMSDIPVWKLPLIYGVLVSMAVMYHLGGLVSGLVMKKAKGAAGTAVGVMMFLNLFFGSCAGGLLSHLTPWPTVMWTANEMRDGPFGRPPGDPGGAFYGFEFPPPLMSIAVQGVISTMLWLAACRRIKNEGAPLLSKPGTIAYFLVLLALLFVDTMLGMTSPGPMGMGRMFGGGGQMISHSIFPVGSLAVALLMIVLASPSHGHIARGVRRSLRLGRRMGPLSDGASNLLPAACMVGMAIPATVVLWFGFVGVGIFSKEFGAFLMAGGVVAASAAAVAGAMDWAGAQFKRAGGTIVIGIMFVLWGIPGLAAAAAGMSHATEELAKTLGSFFPPVGIGLAMDGQYAGVPAILVQGAAAALFYILAFRARARIWDHERRMMPSSRA